MIRSEKIKDILHATDVQSLKFSFLTHLKYSLAKDEYSATKRDFYKALSLTVRDRLVEKWINTQQTYYNVDTKRVYYLSLEFLMGRSLGNALIGLDLYDNMEKALNELGYDLDELRELEWDAGLGNGGLGRLAACFLDSMATLQLPGYGYGIRYEYGIFVQKIKDGYQVETPDNWLRYGNAWEIERPENLYIINYYGNVSAYKDHNGYLRHEWVNTQDVVAIAYDTPIPGYANNTVNTLRLWGAKSTREFDLNYFQYGDYEKAVSEKVFTETISKVLYPNDNVFEGKELRLKQEYFFVSATLQDIIRRYKKNFPERADYRDFPRKVAIQLNDTHPAIAIAELMRILIDSEHLGWDRAWEITTATFAYTNHTIMQEALERWPLHLMHRVLPRHMEIIYEINQRFIDSLIAKYPGDIDKLHRMSIIEEGDEKKVRMANLCIVGSHSVNGVSALHTEILKLDLFKDFYDLWPHKFNNKTNGITQRRFLRLCNLELAQLISGHIGDSWITNLRDLKKLIPFSNDKDFLKRWHEIKKRNKRHLAVCIMDHQGISINPDSIYDCQLKRIHEYKRQLLNAMHVIYMYNKIKSTPDAPFIPRTVIFAGKAAPGYYMAKLIIKLINSIADVVNNDPVIGEKLKVVFIENYSVTMAEQLLPASDLSEQISTAGTEASGTGNMKFALNGALTIGTLDGANVEIRQEVGKENFFTFGLTAEQIEDLKRKGYNPHHYYDNNPQLRQVIDMIQGGYFNQSQPDLFKPITDSLLYHGDRYFLLADFGHYIECQHKVNEAYADWGRWAKMSILNVASMGHFSSDRTIREYAQDIWNVKPIPISLAGGGGEQD
ncbi:MAG: glycogen/starch/alpha-glucan phosphorylase [Nitrospirae bacterium]|uniref:glycogen/starch/alpha-glucan phosphorylase n=1 Tax=Candidatus Magnetobacterium casense TaxID=1455061 RepID=UPI0006992231|nr:glycogen/starch/alpha-glucan phosphorylase [Candidatus Magnetobacterium casensis]MBF0337976.1 glycogen/starch/alpha-glucan phosphorylase [Nitrospirota bacterium]